MPGRLALPEPSCDNANYREFIRGLQSLFFVTTDADGVEYVIEDQEVNGAELVDYVWESLDRLKLLPKEDPRSFWLRYGDDQH